MTCPLAQTSPLGSARAAPSDKRSPVDILFDSHGGGPERPTTGKGEPMEPVAMCGDERVQDGMCSYVSLEERVSQDHPLRAVRKLTDQVLRSLSGEFDQLCTATGRRSISPEAFSLS
jgi:hypothetical protein